MPNYFVTWEIDIFDAENPRDAAEQAWGHMRREGSQACVFDVIECDSDGSKVRVDLMEPACTCGQGEGKYHPDCPCWDSHVDNYDEGEQPDA